MDNQCTTTPVLQISIMPRIPVVCTLSKYSYVLGTSSTLFNQILLNLPSGNASTAQTVVQDVLQAFNKSQEDIAPYPNPFKAINGSSNSVSTFPNLTLVDGVRRPIHSI
jgi:lysophospholipase